MSTNLNSTPQLDESIRISHLEPMRGDEKKLGFLSFGHWAEVPGSRVPSAAESLHQAIDLAVGAEDIGLDGAFFRVHHFDQQQATPYPLLSAIAAKTERIELGTGVIDMRYENPLYMAELAAMADLIAAGRLQLGVSRGSPESVIRGFESFGYYPAEGENEGDMARRHLDIFLKAIEGEGMAPSARVAGKYAPVQPQSPGLRDRIWWGAGTDSTAVWTAQKGLNLMSSTLMLEDKGIPFDQQQAQQIRLFRSEWVKAGNSGVRVFRCPARCCPLSTQPRHATSVTAPRRTRRTTPALLTTASPVLVAATLVIRRILPKSSHVTRRFRRRTPCC